MTVKELIEILKTMPEKNKIVLGVEGYKTEKKEEIQVINSGKQVLISDNCYYNS